MSKLICQKCIDQVNVNYNFKKQCLESQETLLLISERHSDIDIDKVDIKDELLYTDTDNNYHEDDNNGDVKSEDFGDDENDLGKKDFRK